ncbi:putative diacylglycerol O-acyltransferase tgs1 [Ophidiomyces ophidiicola]|uniref:Diacylglycerol O-acyltransferase tgs1 n=1 Tax=Ophidiomyces ophidiicola TaxID=1387563 RepID=A0ACB8UQW2_9EURO|nr:putative diacylglycerol O-acyltransferase tgs1 [Ophidiomyces ophidiicola]KAI1913316.1 putative diacylglycerol O-acyltransferase tgs1 [Ophidiomyces ophidiicola]KAI1921564.1 putative diacylglycerol O-acyltransferase tgs1 [Ophidiomyces ophidiicola]KAI1931202.1 putative diacylglycerol O-acyltransferase tgs1 [Ophidiomyces ophidiicola]KAI1944418.1 putative diacylglycerol O-acyltransferase tgs1 [Ophidiomyces ophidiicola]KAI1949009.1 putative diacylglycerol O-acyltransferase tgs1 [Ophidiomyces ophi
MADDEMPPPEVKHYKNRAEVPWDIQNYWAQRYNIFSQYDDGVWLTDEAWFGVTPEPVANKIAEHMKSASPQKKSILIDAFAGAGGNSIAFARSNRWRRVYAIEKDPAVLQCAKHNAEIYGVADQITWFQGDCFDILKNNLKELAPYSVVFASPPWGGPGYRSDEIFNLSTMEPYSLEFIYSRFSDFTADMALFLPRSSDLRQLAACVKDGNRVMTMHYCMDGASKALCIYYGDFKFEEQ